MYKGNEFIDWYNKKNVESLWTPLSMFTYK